MEIETSEQLAFIPEQVESILIGVIDGILKAEVYLEEKVSYRLFCDLLLADWKRVLLRRDVIIMHQ